MVGDSITTLAFSGVAYWWRFIVTAVMGAFGVYTVEGNGALDGGAPVFVDAGHSGGTLQYCIDNFATQVTANSPTVLILMIGTNDSDPAVFNQATWEANLNLYLQMVYSALPGIKVMLVGPWLSGRLRPDGSNSRDANLTIIVNKMKERAAFYNVPHVDIRSQYFQETDDPAAYTVDGTHPTVYAAQKMSACALRQIVVG